MGLFGIDITAAELSLQMSEANEKRQMDLSSLAPAGFETLSRIEVYNSENLYEKINGKAPFYTESGFQELFTQRFASKDRDNLWFELYVYDMGTVRNAFSVFSVQRRADADILPLFHPLSGYGTSNALYFVNGNYYIELVGSDESGELFKAMTEIPDKLRKKLAVDKVTEIAELSLFPSENIVPGSVKLYLANAFGFEGLTDTFTAQYEIDGETITAFLSKRVGSRDAEAIAKSYHKFLMENGAVVKKAFNKILADKVIDFYDTTEILLSKGQFMVGIHEAENQKSAEKLAVMLINNLSRAAKAVNNE